MKKILSISFVAVLFAGIIGLSSCKKDVVVTVSIDDQEVCLPNSGGLQWQYGYDKTFEILTSQVQSAFSQASITYANDRIKSAKFKNFKLKVSTTAANFDDISGASVYVKTTSPTLGGSATELGQQVAYIDNIGNGNTEITLNLNGLELKSLLSEAKLYVTIRTFNKATGNAAVCIKLTSGIIEIQAQK